MKLAMFSQDGDTQIVFTPESDFEVSVLREIKGGDFEMYRAEFYETHGGYIRMGAGYDNFGAVLGVRPKERSSLIFRTRKDAKERSE